MKGLYLWTFIIVFTITSSISFAKKKTSGASRMSNDLKQCVSQAVNGRETNQCTGENRESDDCVGLRLSIQNSLKTTECKQYSRPVCYRYGYKQNDQSEWVAVSSGHLSLFANCVREAYPLIDRNDLSVALEDDAFVRFLQSVDDGSSTYGMVQGSILIQLLKGERLSSILKNSSVGKKLDKRLLQEIIEAAETPTPIELISDVIAENDTQAINNIPSIKKKREQKTIQERSITALKKGSYRWEIPKGRQKTDIKTAQGLPEKPLPPIYKRVLQNNIYSLGLDRTLFERISSVYMKRSPELQSLGEYIKLTPNTPPKDIKEVIERGSPAHL